MHPDVEASRVREMWDKWRVMQQAQEAYALAKDDYLKAQLALTGAFPEGEQIGPYAIGDTLIEDDGGRDPQFRFFFRQCKRIKTSE